MIELVRDLREINVFAKFENDLWKNYGRESVNGACLPCRPPAHRAGDDNTPEPLRAVG